MPEESLPQSNKNSHSQNANANSFSEPAAVANYAQNPPRIVPGFADLQRMTMLLLAEQAPDNAKILVLGAGGGLELKVFAEANPGWQFDGVDPSAEMLELARTTLGQLIAQVQLHRGYIDTAPEGPFDAASCLLTFHFLSREERQRTLFEVHRRLKPGAPFVVAHLSFPQNEPERTRWLSRYASFATSSGIAPEAAQKASMAIAERLPLLSPEEDKAMLYNAGFSDVNLFYTGFCFRGWVAYR
ncbi:class I SAM-dependent methyltransferase [Spirosoma daeguense]